MAVKRVKQEIDTVVCGNKKCGKSVVPIQYVNGDWYCPECLQSILPKKISDENGVTEFAESQACMFSYISEQAQNDAMLEKAIRLCRKAAFQGNPYALYNLAYYCENGYDKVFIDKNGFARKCLQEVKEYLNNLPDTEDGERIRADFENGSLLSLPADGEEAESDAFQGAVDAKFLHRFLLDYENAGTDLPLFGVFRIDFSQMEEQEKTNIFNVLSNLRSYWNIFFYNDRKIESVVKHITEYTDTKVKSGNAGSVVYFGFIVNKKNKRPYKLLKNIGKFHANFNDVENKRVILDLIMKLSNQKNKKNYFFFTDISYAIAKQKIVRRNAGNAESFWPTITQLLSDSRTTIS